MSLLLAQSGHHTPNAYNKKGEATPALRSGYPACTEAASEQEGSACSHKFRMQTKCQYEAAPEVHRRGPTLANETTVYALRKTVTK
jgi:hypothetical protein